MKRTKTLRTQASDVAIAQVISATPLNSQQVEYRFLTLEQLAGQAQLRKDRDGRRQAE